MPEYPSHFVEFCAPPRLNAVYEATYPTPAALCQPLTKGINRPCPPLQIDPLLNEKGLRRTLAAHSNLAVCQDRIGRARARGVVVMPC